MLFSKTCLGAMRVANRPASVRREPRASAKARRALLLASILLAACCVSRLSAQVVFSARVNGGNGTVTGLFVANGGTVTGIPTGLPSNDFAFVSRNGRTTTISSVDPAHPSEASSDLFLHDLISGQTAKLWNNTTTTAPDGSNVFYSPMFSRASDSGQLVAFVNQVSTNNNQGQGGSHRRLEVVRTSDGMPVSTAEIGHGNQVDFFSSEFVGVSWFPNSALFVSPAYVNVTTQPQGQPTVAAGLVVFGPNQFGQYVRLGVLTVPNVYDGGPLTLIHETHAYPAISPDGQQIAFFRITYPNPVMTEPVQAALIVADLNTGAASVLANFNPAVMPLGVSWSSDMGTLVFGLANQIHVGNQYPALADPDSATMHTIDLATLQVGGVSGAPAGFFPNVFASIFRNGFE